MRRQVASLGFTLIPVEREGQQGRNDDYNFVVKKCYSDPNKIAKSLQSSVLVAGASPELNAPANTGSTMHPPNPGP